MGHIVGLLGRCVGAGHTRDGAGDVVGAGGGAGVVRCLPAMFKPEPWRSSSTIRSRAARVTRTNTLDAVRKTQFVRT